MQDHDILESGGLLDRLSAQEDDQRMPPEGEPLKEEELAVIKKWMAAGAPAPANEAGEADPAQHWAFQKIKRPAVPELGESNPIDAFLAKAQKTNELKPQETAPRSLLIRRLYLDLIGLPPSVDQLQSDQPVEALIDRLIDSPQYGETLGSTLDGRLAIQRLVWTGRPAAQQSKAYLALAGVDCQFSQRG